MAFDLNTFTSDILKEVQVSDSEKQVLNSILSNPAVAKRLEESTLRQSDYSSKMSEYQKKIKAAQDYWDGLVDWDKKAKAELEQEKTRIKNQLAEHDLGLDSSDKVHPDMVRKEELQKLAQEAIAYNNAITKLSMQHFKEFGEILNLDDVVKVSTENGGININLAYDRMVGPKRKEANDKEVAEMIAKAKEEGKQEALKNLNIPTVSDPMLNQNTALDALNKKAEERPEYGTMAAIKAWREARGKGVINTAF